MSYTQEAIYNLALNHLGVSAVVQNTSTISPRITVLNNQYPIAKEQVMKAFDWNFLNRFRSLTLSTESSPDPRYLYAYDYPNDCIAARYIVDSSGGEYKKFDITTASNGSKLILCNINPAILCYTRSITAKVPESFFSSEFVTALSFYLAYLCADSITGSSNKKQLCYQGYMTELARAKAMNATESVENDEDKTTYLDARN